jgi:tRNA A-37 threonylcarbamoyl transferase component Bud32
MALTPRLLMDAAGGGDGKKYTKVVTNPKTGRKNRVRYGAKGYTIAPGTDKGDQYCARSFGDMKSHGKDCSGPDRNTPLCLSRAKWRCSGKTSRRDAPEPGKGKPCGNSFIPKNEKCSKKNSPLTPNVLKTAAKVGLIAGVATGGLLLARKHMTMDEWRKSSQNPRNNPKLTPEEHQRIADEAIAGGQKWDVQEKINARRRAEIQADCGGGLGKTSAPTKFDAAVLKPRCQLGAGAFGTYFVHPSGEYGVKLLRDDPTAEWEFDRLGKAHAAGVNVPEPLSINRTSKDTETLVLTHMKGYETLADTYPTNTRTLADAPSIVGLRTLREFRKLHMEGLAHGDIHGGNIMVQPRSKRVALIDFGYSTELDDWRNPLNNRNGVENLMVDLNRLPYYAGIDEKDFKNAYSGVYDNIEIQASDYVNKYSSAGWDRYQIAVKRFHDALEDTFLGQAGGLPRSRFVRSIDQPRIPGLTRRILTANANTKQREMMEWALAQENVLGTRWKEAAGNLGVKPGRLFLAMRPEREARLAGQGRRPFGNTAIKDLVDLLVPPTTHRGQRPFTVPPLRDPLSEWED